MQFDEAMQKLSDAGTAQNRKVYSRHGVGENQYGVSYGNLRAMAKEIKKNQRLAEQLWGTGNHDARVFATMIANPKEISLEVVESWVKDLDNYVITDAFSGLVASTSMSSDKADEWIVSDDEWIGQCGWNLVAHLAMKDKKLPDDYFERLIPTIENEIHSRKNRVRYSMNSALIAIGIRNEMLTDLALKAAAKVGVVEVDHGETGCLTPDAAEYIKKTLARKKQKSAAG